MIIKSFNDEQTGWESKVMPETCDVASFEYNDFVNARLAIGQWYNVRGGYDSSYAFGITGTQVATSLNSKLNNKVNALVSKQKSPEYRTEKEAAKKEHGGNKVYLGIRGNTFGFYSEEEFLIPEIDKAIPPDTPMVKPAVAPETPKQITTEPKPVSTGSDPGKPVEEPGPETVELPSTMASLTRALSCMGKRCSKYDFGIRTVPHAASKPSINTTIRAYKKVVLLAVARALVAREFGMEFSRKSVIKGIRKDWTNNSQTKRYHEVMNEHRSDPVVRAVVTEMQEAIADFIDGNVKTNCAFMNEWEGKRWSIKAFLRYSWSRFKVSFSREDSKKKSKKKPE